MPEYGYSSSVYDRATDVRGSLREVDISPKAARELATAIRGLPISRARAILNDVVDIKRPVAFRRYKLKVGHKAGLNGFAAGRYPRKAALKFLELLDNLESTADFKGFDPSSIVLVHITAYPGRKLKRSMPRAMGKTSPKNKILVHVEAIGRVM
ncbi:MAG: 50S ribosomal protein L22 [Nitrososphaerota archaeon]|jgi:large subunit ribosomal protein L22|nr:50S ribosomal protein L22 [Nitrososphaerota archaeon]MDG7036851.1 50S ribosomal protein L22 [Nitrososphaerota archaeon]MDG7039047.1 50S ribosomal protein L22 [Nitrososphaerota archaeon]MDG7040796.1 50S ribosomal protein L22 [Nitrososphaerota archaeon]MDG7042336.1 50S ribosomal protein L22 [Nitrososphaerota archaeon]